MKALFRALALLPLPVLHAAGVALGWLTYALSPTYRRRFRENAAQAGFSPGEVRAGIAQAGQLIAETPRLWFGASVPVEWRGTALIDKARAEGRGILFLTPHLGCFEVAARDFADRFGRITVLYRPARKAWLRDIVATSRVRENLAAAPTTLGGVKQLLKALKSGEAVGLLPDQVPPQGLGAWAPFFGRPAYTMTLPGRLAQQAGAAVILAWGERLPGGRGFVVHLRPWEGEFEREPEAAARQVNARMEELIRQAPSQYLWAYARYKSPREEPAG